MLRLSKAGTCTRALVFEYLGYAPIPDSPEALARMAAGRELEPWAIEAIRAEGYTVTDQQREVCLLGVPGHIDGIVTDPWGRESLLEIKSMGFPVWKAFVETGFALHPYFARYRAQVASYLAALEMRSALIVAVLRSKEPQIGQEVWTLDTREVDRVCTRFERVRNATTPDVTLAEPGKHCDWCGYRDRCEGRKLNAAH